MAIKCFGKGVHASDLQKKFGREILITHLKGNIYYFDFNRESVLSRTYLVESPDSLNQITFTTDITLKNSVDKLHDFISNWLNNAR